MSTTLRQVWLILHLDLRVRLREMRGSFSHDSLMLTLLAIGYLILHALAWPLVSISRESNAGPIMEGIGWIIVGFAAAIGALSNLRFDRDDSALLLASPVSQRVVLIARIVGQAAAGILPVAFFATPFFNLAIALKGFHYLGCYPTALAVAILVASGTYLLALNLSRKIGAKRVLTLVRMLGALLGIFFILLGQLPRLFGKSGMAAAGSHIPALSEWPVIAQVVRAGQGHPLDLLLGLFITAAVLALVVTTSADALLRGIQATQENTPRKSRAGAHRWTASLAEATYRKELRLMLRTPMLFVQLLSALGPILPLVIIQRSFDAGSAAVLAVVLAQLGSAPFLQATTAMESGWDLVRGSPTPEVRLRIAKLAAALTFPLGGATLACLGVAWWARPGLAAVAFAMSVVGSVGFGWVGVSHFRPNFGKTIKPKLGAADFGQMIMGFAIFFPSVGGVWAWAAEKYLLASGVLGAAALTSFLVVAFTQLREIPEAALDAARAAAATSK